jgi:hypothetical protein
VTSEEVGKLQVYEEVKILIGRFKGQTATVLKIEMHSGARNGWVTVQAADGTQLLYAGEEIAKAK